MKQSFFVFLLLVTSCNIDDKKNNTIESADVSGNWECIIENEQSNPLKFNLYLNNGTCHYGSDQDNRNTYSIEGKLLKIKDVAGNMHHLDILSVDDNQLSVKLKCDLLVRSYGVKENTILVFRKLNKQNHLQLKQLTFKWESGYASVSAFTLQFNTNRLFLFEGAVEGDSTGFYTGELKERFLKELNEKFIYIDFADLNTEYLSESTDQESIQLEFVTNKGIFKCLVYGNDKEPSQIRNLIEYIQSNRKQLNYKPLDLNNFLKSGGTPQEKEIEKILNFIPC